MWGRGSHALQAVLGGEVGALPEGSAFFTDTRKVFATKKSNKFATYTLA